LAGKPEGKRPLEKRRKWGDNIKMDLREMGMEDVNRIHLAENMDQ
jgi:hypothetical protein